MSAEALCAFWIVQCGPRPASTLAPKQTFRTTGTGGERQLRDATRNDQFAPRADFAADDALHAGPDMARGRTHSRFACECSNREGTAREDHELGELRRLHLGARFRLDQAATPIGMK